MSGVLEYGVVTLRGGAVAETRSRTCRATGRVRPEDAAVHGLTADQVAGEAPFSADFDYFAGLRECGPLAAHFSGTENSLLKNVWPYPRSSPDFSREGTKIAEWGPWLDSARLWSECFPTAPSLQLEALVSACGLQEELNRLAARSCPATRQAYHCALYDALAGALLLAEVLRHPNFKEVSVSRLLALSVADGRKRSDLEQGTLF